MVNKKRNKRKTYAKQTKLSTPLKTITTEKNSSQYNLRKVPKKNNSLYNLRRVPTDDKPVYSEFSVRDDESVDLFDELLQSSGEIQLKKEVNPVTYSKKTNDQVMDHQDIIRNRKQVIQWLNDTKNNFERTTQTQCNINEVPEVNFNIPSVSQRDKPKEIFRRKSISQSVMEDYRITSDNTQLRRHSISGDVTEKDVFQRIEDQCLDRLEEQHKEIINESLQQISGWDRMKQMEKTIRKCDKTPRQLKIQIKPTKSPVNKLDFLGHLLEFDLTKFEDSTKAELNQLKSSPMESNEIIEKPIEIKQVLIEYKPNLTVINEIKRNNLVFNDLKILLDNFKKCFDLNREIDESDSLLNQSNTDRYFNEIDKRIGKLNSFFHNLSGIKGNFFKTDAQVQTEEDKIDAGMQTEDEFSNQIRIDKIDIETQTDLEIIKKMSQQTQTCLLKKLSNSTQTNLVLLTKQTQTITKNVLNKQQQTTFNFCNKETQTDDFVIKTDNKYNIGGTLDYRQFSSQDVINGKSLENEENKNLVELPNANDNLKRTRNFENLVESPNRDESIKQIRNTLDYLEYNTQDVINQHSKSNSEDTVKSKELLGNVCSTKLVESLECNKNIFKSDTLDYLQFNTQDVINESRKSTEKNVENLLWNDGNVNLVDAPKNDGNILEKDSLDYLEFNTQDVINQQQIKSVELPKHSNFTKNLVELPKSSGNIFKVDNLDCLQDVIQSQNNNSKPPENSFKYTLAESLKSTRNIFKRTREEEDENSFNKRPCNKFINNDISIDFEGESTLIDKSFENINYNVNKHLNQILERFKENEVRKTAKNTQEIIKEWDIIIENATKNNESRPSSRKELFKENRKSEEQFSESLFIKNYLSQCPIIKEDVLKEIDTNCMGEEKIKILQNIKIKSADIEEDDENYVISSQTSEDMFNSDTSDIVEPSPQKKLSGNRLRSRLSSLDVTLPPPIEFQDNEAIIDLDKTLVDIVKTPKVVEKQKKVTSTPFTNCRYSESVLSLSPIKKHERNPIEVIKQSKYTPLKVISQKSPISQKQSKISDFLSAINLKPCLTCTRLKKDDILLINSLANKNLITFQNCFSNKVTHLIVSVNEENFIKDHTIKYIHAIAAGLWILNMNWVKECLKKKCIVPEEQFEVLDVNGGEGPKLSRLNRVENPLFKGYKMYITSQFNSTTKEDVENIVKSLGAQTVARPEDLMDTDGICVVVTEAVASQNFSLYETWLEILRVVTVDIEWISRSIGQYKVCSLRQFILCSDNFIDKLNYPAELICDETCTESDYISH